MINPSAIGVAVLILIAVTTMVGSSSANSNYGFHRSQHTLSKVIASASVKDVMQSYQRQTSTISLSRSNLTEPHMLSLTVPPGTDLQGDIYINQDVKISLNGSPIPVDIGPYLTASENRVIISGTYSPTSGAVSISFEGPNTLVQQQIGGTGEIDYQLNLLVE